jgi:hypothetical protein
MAAQWLTAAIVIGVLSPASGHFGTVRPLWTRVARWMVVYLRARVSVEASGLE